MFGTILEIINSLIQSLKDGHNIKKISDKKRFALEMLSVYFFLYDTCDDGENLLDSVELNISEQIKECSQSELAELIKKWDNILKKQSLRLYTVQGYICSTSYIAVIDPDSQKQIEKIIGNKDDQILTLHAIGANLFFRTIFPIQQTPKDIARTVQSVLMMDDEGPINKENIRKTLVDLRNSLNDFRRLVNNVLSTEEIVKYSDEARKRTKLQ